MSEAPHDHDENGNCIPPDNGLHAQELHAQELPVWRFSMWDVAGIALTGIGGVLTVGGQMFNLWSRDCAAMANYTRQNYDLRLAARRAAQARREIAQSLNGLLASNTLEEGGS